MKLVEQILSTDLPPLNEALANALLKAAQGLTEAAGILLGKPAENLQVRVASLHGVVDLVNEFLRAKARANRSDRYLRQLRVTLTSFANGRAFTRIDQVHAEEVEKWIQNRDWAPRTARGYLADVRTMFNYAVKRGYVARNPAAAVELPLLENTRPIRVHAPDQVKQVLEAARSADLNTCRLLAVRYFAGVRSAEAHRLRESDLKLEQGLLEVPAEKAKTRSRRLVTIQPNLRAWLELGGELKATSDMTIRKVIRVSKVEWEHNVTRHSFVSYHLARFENAAKTALEAGHSEAMLFKHYRALVTPAAAEQFWAISPK